MGLVGVFKGSIVVLGMCRCGWDIAGMASGTTVRLFIGSRVFDTHVLDLGSEESVKSS